MFRNLNLGTRLGAAFAAVLILMLGVAGIGFKRVGDLQAEISDLVQDKNRKVRGCEFFVSALPPGAAGADVARKGTILRWRRKRGCRLAFPPLCPDFGVSQPPNQAFALPRTYLCLDRPIPVRESQRAAGCAPGRTERRQPSLSGYPVPVVGSAPGCAPAR